MADEAKTPTPEPDPYPLQKKASQSDMTRAGVRNGMTPDQIEQALKNSGMT